MVKAFSMIFIFGIVTLFSQDFLDEIEEIEDLALDQIITPAVADTIGISNWSEYFYSVSKGPFSPDSQLRAAVRTKNGFVDGIWIMDMSTSIETQIDNRGFAPKWSPDGRYLAFLKQKVLVGKYVRGYQLYGENELWICNANGDDKRKLTTNTHVAEYMWSPDSRCICFEGVDSTGQIDEPYYIAVLNIETGEKTIIDTGSPFNDINFSFSPDGRMIAYCKPFSWELEHEWRVTDAEIFIASIDGSERTQLTNTDIVETMVKWLVDGKSLIVEQVNKDPADIPSQRYVKIVLKTK